ncbi:MAG: hypothetical protein MMC23_010053, partial [Stictis urceolatum]|nr:hypothetical protein [Stictis urceolata]
MVRRGHSALKKSLMFHPSITSDSKHRVSKPTTTRQSARLRAKHQLFQETGGYNPLPSPESEVHGPKNSPRKRKRDDEHEHRDFCNKKVRQQKTESPKTKPQGDIDPVVYWAENQEWPPNFAREDPNMRDSRDSSPKKRSRQTSYSQSVKDGESPRAYSP